MGSSRSHVGKGRSQMGKGRSQNRLPTELKPNLTRNKNLFKGLESFFVKTTSFKGLRKYRMV